MASSVRVVEEASVFALMGYLQPQACAKPWMEKCKFTLGTTENIGEIIDLCIQSGRFGLDLETSGLDNRVLNGQTVDHIAGVCMAPYPDQTYYIPIAHFLVSDMGDSKEPSPLNVPWGLFAEHFKRLLVALEERKTVAVFHNGKFDHEFLQFNGKEPLGEWDRPYYWDDTLILAYLRNSRARVKGLKDVSAASPDADFNSQTGGPGLGMEMIELAELWPPDYKGNYDFTTLDPSRQDVLWYAGSDALCTLRLYGILSPIILKPDSDGQTQKVVYDIEKGCVAATRWMERNRIHIDVKTIAELIAVGQKEWYSSIMDVYEEASRILGRDVMPGKYHELKDSFRLDDPYCMMDAQLQVAESRAKQNRPDAQGKITGSQGKEWPPVYDVNSPPQIGLMFEEMGVPGLKRTEKSGQVKTTKEELDRVIEETGSSFPFMGKVKRFRETSKALASYLQPMLTDCEPSDQTIRINFQGHKVDTGRFSTPSKDTNRSSMIGWPSINLQGLPSTYDPKRPECMARIRECITARSPNKYIVACDYSGVELRIVTNFSREPLWLREFFHCSGCGRTFEQGNGVDTPLPPPTRCPNCGSDKIGDLHTLTALSIYGSDAQARADWKKLRGNGKCVHPDTIIIGQGTPYRIGTLPVKQNEFLALPPEGKVWDGAGWQPLLETYGGGKKQLFHIVSRRGVLTCSAEHRIKAANGDLLTPETITKGVVLPELGVPENVVSDGHWADIPYGAFDGVPQVIARTNTHLAYLAGLILGDGTKSVSYCAITHGNVSKTDPMGVSYLQWQSILMDACRDAGFSPVARKEGVYLGSRHVIRFLAALQLYDLTEGTKGSRRLRIPDWVWQSGSRGIFSFLGGLFDTDGTVFAKDKNLSVTTKDPIFAGHIASALQALGMQASVETTWNEPYRRWYFRVKVFREDSVLFIPYMKHPGKVARLKAKGHVAKPECGRRKPNEVMLILDAGEQECVDLHVGSESHLYWANGFHSHNSCNFAMCYGGGGSAAQRATGVDKNEGWRIKRTFDKTYAGLEKWWGSQHKFAHKHGFVRTAFGRKYPLPDINSPDERFMKKAERNAINGPVQGSSADITKSAMALIYKEFKARGWLEKAMMVITIHDELVFEIDGDILEEAIETILPIMTRNAYIMSKRWPIPFTCDVEIGHSWIVPWDLNAMRYREVRFDGDKKIKEPKEPEQDKFKNSPPGEFEKAVAEYPAKHAQWEALPNSWPAGLDPLFKMKTPENPDMIQARVAVVPPTPIPTPITVTPEVTPEVDPEVTPEVDPEASYQITPDVISDDDAPRGIPGTDPSVDDIFGTVDESPAIPSKSILTENPMATEFLNMSQRAHQTNSNSVFEFHLQEDLSSGLIDRMGTVLNICLGGGSQTLVLFDRQGQKILTDEWFDGPILVNSVAFIAGAQILGIHGREFSR